MLLASSTLVIAESPSQDSPPATVKGVSPARTEVIEPIVNTTFDRGGKTRERKQGGNPRKIKGYLAFDGSMDGNRQVDPQIAVGGGYVLHGTNGGMYAFLFAFLFGKIRKENVSNLPWSSH